MGNAIRWNSGILLEKISLFVKETANVKQLMSKAISNQLSIFTHPVQYTYVHAAAGSVLWLYYNIISRTRPCPPPPERGDFFFFSLVHERSLLIVLRSYTFRYIVFPRARRTFSGGSDASTTAMV